MWSGWAMWLGMAVAAGLWWAAWDLPGCTGNCRQGRDKCDCERNDQ